jgi:hypothetical protein
MGEHERYTGLAVQTVVVQDSTLMPTESAPVVDFTNAGPVQPFRFWIAAEPPPATSESVRTEAGALINALPPGYWECALVNETIPELWAIFYWLQGGPNDYLIVSCFDHYFDGIDEIMSGRDFGEPVTELLRRRWPLFSKLRDAGVRSDPSEGCLVRFRTTSDVQWGVTVHVDGFELTRLEQFYEGPSGEAFAKLQHLTIDLMKETHEGPLAVPGFLEVLAGDDYTTRRLKQMESSIHDVLHIVDLFAKALSG